MHIYIYIYIYIDPKLQTGMDPTGEFVVVANTVTAGNTDNWGIYTLSLRADQVRADQAALPSVESWEGGVSY